MDFASLPRYQGPPNSPRGWAEPDERGETPSLRLRDYVALALMIVIGFPISFPFTVHQWTSHRNLSAVNLSRDEFVWNRQLEP